VAEACEQLGIGKTRFYELLNAGEITVVDISPDRPKQPRPIGTPGRRRTLRVEQSVIDAYIERGRIPTP
jgi:hypothetical protein